MLNRICIDQVFYVSSHVFGRASASGHRKESPIITVTVPTTVTVSKVIQTELARESSSYIHLSNNATTVLVTKDMGNRAPDQGYIMSVKHVCKPTFSLRLLRQPPYECMGMCSIISFTYLRRFCPPAFLQFEINTATSTPEGIGRCTHVYTQTHKSNISVPISAVQ